MENKYQSMAYDQHYKSLTRNMVKAAAAGQLDPLTLEEWEWHQTYMSRNMSEYYEDMLHYGIINALASRNIEKQ